MVIGGYLWYIAANFQRIHEYGRVGYVNLTIDQGARGNSELRNLFIDPEFYN